MNWTEHTATKDIVCPYCGDRFEDDGEFHGVKKWACDVCGKKFEISADYTVTFTTRQRPDWN